MKALVDLALSVVNGALACIGFFALVIYFTGHMHFYGGSRLICIW